MSNGIYYFIATNYDTSKDKILVLNIEYNYGQEPYNIGRDAIHKEGYKVKGMYGREEYALEALGGTDKTKEA